MHSSNDNNKIEINEVIKVFLMSTAAILLLFFIFLVQSIATINAGGPILKKHLIISSLLICLFFDTSTTIGRSDNKTQSISKELILFSEHRIAFYSSHAIKLLDISSKKVTDLSVKTYSYGDFYIIKSKCIGWIGKNELFIWNPETRATEKKKIQIYPLPIETLISISPSGNKIAYLKPYGRRLYLGGEPKIGQRINSLGFISELHVFDLMKNEDRVITNRAFDWGAPRWSPDEKKILFTRPSTDDYFEQSFLNNVRNETSDPWQKIAQSAIFVYDFDKNIDYRLCLGIAPQWSPKGDKIAFLTEDNKIGIFNLVDEQKNELPLRGSVDLASFKTAWLTNETHIAYLGKPLRSLISHVKGLTRGYERPLSLWVISIDGAQEEYIQTRNFGDIKCTPKGYKDFRK